MNERYFPLLGAVMVALPLSGLVSGLALAPADRWTRICEETVRTEPRPNGYVCEIEAKMCRQPGSFEYTTKLWERPAICHAVSGETERAQ